MFGMCTRSQAVGIGILLLFILDRFLKWLALEGYSLTWVGGITFRFLANRGATFGLSVPYIGLISLVVLIMLTIYAYFHPMTGLLLVIVGGFSNVMDRLLYGYVIDYLHIPFLPIVGKTFFNVADILIDIGVLLLLWELLRK